AGSFGTLEQPIRGSPTHEPLSPLCDCPKCARRLGRFSGRGFFQYRGGKMNGYAAHHPRCIGCSTSTVNGSWPSLSVLIHRCRLSLIFSGSAVCSSLFASSSKD